MALSWNTAQPSVSIKHYEGATGSVSGEGMQNVNRWYRDSIPTWEMNDYVTAVVHE